MRRAPHTHTQNKAIPKAEWEHRLTCVAGKQKRAMHDVEAVEAGHAMVCVLLVPVVVPAADPGGAGGTGEGVQALQQCGGASSGAAVCTGEAAATAQAEQASRRWWWVAPGAAVAVAASGIIALVVMMKGDGTIDSWLLGGGKKRRADGDLESDSLLNGPAATVRNPHTNLVYHSGWDAVHIEGTHAACVTEIERRICAGLIDMQGGEAPSTGILIGCAMSHDRVASRIIRHSKDTNGRLTCGGGCPVPRPAGSSYLLRVRAVSQATRPFPVAPTPRPLTPQTATFPPPGGRRRGASSW